MRALPNDAGLAIDVEPGTDLEIGMRINFRIATKKQGYLILLDVDPRGKVTRIFPYPRSLIASRGLGESSNLIRPGRPMTIPDSGLFAGFEFVATPPTGTAIVVALLSDKPVQLADFPDLPPSLAGQASALAYVREVALHLKIAQNKGGLQDVAWSFDAKFYTIR